MQKFMGRLVPNTRDGSRRLDELVQAVRGDERRGNGSFFSFKLGQADTGVHTRIGMSLPEVEAELRAWGARWASVKVEAGPGWGPGICKYFVIRAAASFADKPEALKERMRKELPDLHPQAKEFREEAELQARRTRETAEQSAFVAGGVALARAQGVDVSDDGYVRSSGVWLNQPTLGWKSATEVATAIQRLTPESIAAQKAADEAARRRVAEHIPDCPECRALRACDEFQMSLGGGTDWFEVERRAQVAQKLVQEIGWSEVETILALDDQYRYGERLGAVLRARFALPPGYQTGQQYWAEHLARCHLANSKT